MIEAKNDLVRLAASSGSASLVANFSGNLVIYRCAASPVAQLHQRGLGLSRTVCEVAHPSLILVNLNI